jgi:hypothetical protein
MMSFDTMVQRGFGDKHTEMDSRIVEALSGEKMARYINRETKKKNFHVNSSICGFAFL